MIESRYFIINTLLLAVGTIAIRGCFIALSSRLTITANVRKLFTYIPAAILPAFIVPSVYFHQGVVDLVGNKERLLVLVAAGIIFYFYRSTLLIIGLGLGLLYLLTSII